VGKKNKLKKFEETKTFSNFFQPSYFDVKNGYYLKGNWNVIVFKNSNPIVLELGCGKGEYTIGLAMRDKDINYIGVDIKGARMWKGSKISNEKKLTNVAFLRTNISLIENFFDKNEISEIWVVFPDPQPRGSKSKKRLTSPEFLKSYTSFLKPEGKINLKTDSQELYDFTLDVINEFNLELISKSNNIYNDKIVGPITEIQTFYEKIWLEEDKTIKFVSFSLGKLNFGNPSAMQKLLEKEGIIVENDKIINFEKHFWKPNSLKI